MPDYKQTDLIPPYLINYKVAEFLLEDIPEGDITTEATIDKNVISTAVIQAEEDLVFVGEFLFHYFFDDTFKVQTIKQDGAEVKSGEIIAKITGPSHLLLIRERVLLNLIQRLSGIATLTKKMVNIASQFGVKVLDTRKTTPGLRIFEKYAVRKGGGVNHRLDLSSGILIKDNHIKAAGSIKNAIEKCMVKYPGYTVEIEVENIDQIKKAVQSGARAFLLDNMKPAEIKKAVRLIRSHPGGIGIFIEASGGITLENVKAYSDTGVDAVSVGALTHSFRSADIHIEFDRVGGVG